MEIFTFCTFFKQWNNIIKFRPVCFIVEVEISIILVYDERNLNGLSLSKEINSYNHSKTKFTTIMTPNRAIEFQILNFLSNWTIGLISWDHSKFFRWTPVLWKFWPLHFFQPIKSQHQICFLVIGWSQNFHSTSIWWKKLKWSQLMPKLIQNNNGTEKRTMEIVYFAFTCRQVLVYSMNQEIIIIIFHFECFIQCFNSFCLHWALFIHILNHGLLNRWTSQYGWGNTTGWLERIVNILQISHHIFIQLSVCTSMRVIVLRT